MRNIQLNFILLFITPLTLNAQLSFLSLIGENCPPVLSSKYTYNNYNIGNHGNGYTIYKDGNKIDGDEGDFGCCTVYDLYPLTDSIVFKFIDNAGVISVYKTINSGQSWTWFGGAQNWPIAMVFINENVGYILSKFPGDENHIWIEKASGVNSKELISGDSVKISSNTVNIYDTIKGPPLCANLHSTGFRIQKDGTDIDYKIYVSSTQVGIRFAKTSSILPIYPNPAKDYLIVKADNFSRLKMFDEFGRVILELSCIVGDNKVDISNLKNGFYFIRLEDDNKVLTNKLVKN